jgi:hypothetical protein
MMGRFCRYLDKVFAFGQKIGSLTDRRKLPRIATAAVWGSVFFLFVLRRGSLNAMESALRVSRRMERLIGQVRPSADRMGDVLGFMEPDQLRELLSGINHRLGRNKALKNDWPLRVAALDGHEFFCSRHRCCPQCSERKVKVKGKKVTEFYHRGVVFHLVGFPMAIPLDVELTRPGEGEVVTAKRLLERAITRYGRFFDVVVGDALYMEAPFFTFCLKHKKDVIAVLKGKRALLYDAKGIFSLTKPKVWTEDRVRVRAWDQEGFTTAEGIGSLLRVLHTEEEVSIRERHRNRWVEKTERHHWWWATTLPVSRLSTRMLWRAAHRRWDIENDLFNTLVTHWSLDHCFKHEPTAILNFVLTLFIAFVLLQSFYRGNLKPERRAHLSLIGLAMELYLGVVTMTRCASWVPP